MPDFAVAECCSKFELDVALIALGRTSLGKLDPGWRYWAPRLHLDRYRIGLFIDDCGVLSRAGIVGVERPTAGEPDRDSIAIDTDGLGVPVDVTTGYGRGWVAGLWRHCG